MNKKAQLVETVGALILLIGSIIGGISIAGNISFNEIYVGSSTKQDNKTNCVYKESCKPKIDNLICGEKVIFNSLEEANSEGYILCQC